MGAPVYSLPAGNTNIEVPKDPAKLPLFVTLDIVIGETSMYADFIIADTSYLERWEFHESHPKFIMKNAPVRQLWRPAPSAARQLLRLMLVCGTSLYLCTMCCFGTMNG